MPGLFFGFFMRWEGGTIINPVEYTTDLLVMVDHSLSSKFTVWYDAAKAVYRAESNVSGVSDVSSSSFAAALNYAISAGGYGAVHVRPSMQPISVKAKISIKDSVVVFLDKETQLELGYNGDMFEFDNVQSGGIVGGYLNGCKSSYAGKAIVIKGNSFRSFVQDTYIYNFDGRGISIEENTSSHNWIVGNRICDVNDEGIMVSRSLANCILNNSVEKTGFHGIVVTGGNNNLISSNVVRDAGGNYVAGFAHGIAVDGNGGADPATGNIVANNSIYDSYMCGIEIADDASNTVVSGNHVDTTTHASSGYGIYAGGGIDGSHNVTISGNVVLNAADIGIFVAGPGGTLLTTSVYVVDNVVMGCGDNGIRFKYAIGCVATNNILR